MRFCTAINCMDGRTQLPVNEFMRRRFGATFVDTITEPGPICILAGQEDARLVESVFHRIDISVEKHGSRAIGVVGHHDCAGNPVDKTTQLDQLRRSMEMLQGRYPEVEIVGLWVDDQWAVEEV